MARRHAEPLAVFERERRFDPSRVVNSAWGTLTLTFTDPAHGKVEFNSVLGYGSGSMKLARLTNPAAAGNPAWTRTGALNIARVGHKAMLLPNGKVLVVGGFEPVGYPPHGEVRVDPGADTAELFDPITGRWELTGKLNSVRGNGFTATLLQNGNALVTGGILDCVAPSCGDGTGLTELLAKSAELYDTSTGTWRLTGSMNEARTLHTATLLRDGRVLVAGGADWSSPASRAEMYDPATGAWTYTGALNTGRLDPSATLLQDGRVLVFGGWVPDNSFGEPIAVTSAEIYDPVAGKWTEYPGPQYAAYADGTFVAGGETAVRLRNGKVLSVGNGMADFYGYGNSSNESFLFDPAALAWVASGSMITQRGSHAATLLASGDVLVTGGDGFFGTAERYNASAGAWVTEGVLNTPRSGHSATLLADGRVLVTGGIDLSRSSSADPTRESELFQRTSLSPLTATGLTGSWYDPAQPGHGLVLEALPGDQLLAEWFAFNQAGQQAWFLGVGSYSGNTATISSVVQPTGGRFIPNFDPSKIVNNPWGTLTFTFTDCDHGRVDFASTAGYGSGSMNLTRLTQPIGVACP